MTFSGLSPAVTGWIEDDDGRVVARVRPSRFDPLARGLRFSPRCDEDYSLFLRTDPGFPGSAPFTLKLQSLRPAGDNPWTTTAARFSTPPPPQPDQDHDGLQDAIDSCPRIWDPAGTDTDGDGVGDVCDNCPGVPNPNQLGVEFPAVVPRDHNALTWLAALDYDVAKGPLASVASYEVTGRADRLGGIVMKVLVAYMSRTGNTRKVAEAIFEAISGEKEIKPIGKVGSIEGYDVAFLGFPIHAMGPDKKTVELLEKHCVNGRNVALFITHMAPEDAQELPTWLDKFRQAASRANIVDVFDCQGQVAKPIRLFMLMAPGAKLRSWARQDNSRGQPDKARLDRARAFSRSVMKRLHENKADAGGKRGKQEK